MVKKTQKRKRAIPRRETARRRRRMLVQEHQDPQRLGQPLQDTVVRPPNQDEIIRTLINQRDSALLALNSRENVEKLIADYDQLLLTVSQGMRRLQHDLRALIQLADL